MSETQTDQLLGVREAAALLGLAPSTVSRYLEKHPELIAADGPKVDLTELRRHRADNVNHQMSGNHDGRLADELPFDDDTEAGADDPVAAEAPAANGVREPEAREPGALTQARTARETVAARLAMLQLEEKLGRVASLADVEAAALDAAQALRDGLAQRNRELAEKLAVMTDVNEIRELLLSSDEMILNRMANVYDSWLGSGAAENAA